MLRRAAPWLLVLTLAIVAGTSPYPALRLALPVVAPLAVAALFATSLLPGRTPLVARAIVELDGAHWLRESAVARFAWRLTMLWVVYLALLSGIVALLALRARDAAPVWLPSAAAFGAVGVPLAVLGLLCGECLLRRRLLPQVPHPSVWQFLSGLFIAWPLLLREPRNRREASLCVGVDHPCLPGHFPGEPIVPAALLLDQVATTAERAWPMRVAGIAQAKFRNALAPGESAHIVLSRNASRVDWSIQRGDTAIASGCLELEA